MEGWQFWWRGDTFEATRQVLYGVHPTLLLTLIGASSVGDHGCSRGTAVELS